MTPGLFRLPKLPRRAGISSWILVGSLLASLPREASGEGVAILPVSAPRALAERMERSLEARLRLEPPAPVLAPARLRAVLLRRPVVASALKVARQEIDAAERGWLRLERDQAVGAARRAVKALRAVGGGLFVPRMVSRARVTMALALLLQPEDPAGARAAFQAAARLDPDLDPSTDRRIPPRARQLFSRALEGKREIRRPAIEALGAVAEHVGVEQVVWIAARGHPGGAEGAEVALYIYDHGSRRLRGPRRIRSSAAELPARTSELVKSGLRASRRGPPAAPARAPIARDPVVGAPLAPREPRPDRRRTTPWYRRWWVWTLAGAVIVGSGIAIGVASSRSDGTYEFNVQH